VAGINPATFYWNAYFKPEKWWVMYMCSSINFVYFFLFWNCSNSVVFFVFSFIGREGTGFDHISTASVV